MKRCITFATAILLPIVTTLAGLIVVLSYSIGPLKDPPHIKGYGPKDYSTRRDPVKCIGANMSIIPYDIYQIGSTDRNTAN